MADINIYSELAGWPHPAVPAVAGTALEGARQGDTVGIDSNGEMVPADAAAGSAQAAVGFLFPERVTDMSQLPSRDKYPGIHHKRKDDAQAGDRVTAFYSNFVVINPDEDWGFTNGPVYLAEGGGLTQTKPADAGDIVQCLGTVTNLDRVPFGEAVWVDVDFDYSTV